MPQISQLAATYASQIFWLLLTFGIVFVTVGLGMLPKVQATIGDRDKSIADDLAAAQAARDAADAAADAWRTRDTANRESALARVNKARAEATAKTEATLAKANAANAERIATGEAAIAAAGASAGAEIERVAAEAAQDIVARVAGLKVSATEAQAAVKEQWLVANLAHADRAEGLPHAGTTHEAGVPTHHAEPNFLGIDATIWVSLAMLVFLAVVVWKGGVKAITGGLDRQIADIKAQLAAAKEIRAEAEALRDEYAQKNSAAEASAQAMLDHAEEEAKGLIAKAKADANDLVARRTRMAEDKIAAAERTAIAEVRARTAAAAAQAAATLIGEKLGAAGDKPLIDRTIADLARMN